MNPVFSTQLSCLTAIRNEHLFIGSSMATFAERDFTPVIDAAGNWARACFINDRSILSDQLLWTAENLAFLDTFFVQNLDESEGKFYDKLKNQMQRAPAVSSKLMAEVLWILYLFPSNIKADSKRHGIGDAWRVSGEELNLVNPMLADAVLEGIGSGGTAFNQHRWREINYAVGLFIEAKKLPVASRASLVSSYDAMTSWLEGVPQDGDRQFRHMLRYLLFPERVERMSSNGSRRKVLKGLGVATEREMRKWTDRQYDDAFLTLRADLERKNGEPVLDFYLPPLAAMWNADSAEDELDQLVEHRDKKGVAENQTAKDSPYVISSGALNRILFGPPGTGKTYELLRLLADQFTQTAATVNPADWRAEQVASRIGTLTWWEAIGAALYDLGKPTSVPDLARHPFVLAIASAKGRTKGVSSTMWGTLQHHALTESKTVNITLKLSPFIFDKTEDSKWSLAGEWREHLSEVVDVVDGIKSGPKPAGEPVRRFSFVTFHQSFSYEEFIEGVTPTVDEDAGNIRYEVKRGLFLRLCDRARADSAHEYAMVIDEINRANVSKVFGELITLIEDDKREGATNEIVLTLPYSGQSFSVPKNVHLIGTMNTADRSLAGLDLALRRRFQFVEMAPKPELLNAVLIDDVNIERMLEVMNQRIEVLLDRDHQIGHAYFMTLREANSLSRLADIFRHQILPLLQEYFFEDWQRISWVLNDHRKPANFRFVDQSGISVDTLFGKGVQVPVNSVTWRINEFAFSQAESYRGIIDAN